MACTRAAFIPRSAVSPWRVVHAAVLNISLCETGALLLSLRSPAHASRVFTDIPTSVYDVFPVRLVLPTPMLLIHRRSTNTDYEVALSWRTCVHSYTSDALYSITIVSSASTSEFGWRSVDRDHRPIATPYHCSGIQYLSTVPGEPQTIMMTPTADTTTTTRGYRSYVLSCRTARFPLSLEPS